jgi:hypothetical protein
MTLGPVAVSRRRASAHGFLGREGEIVIRVYVFSIGFTSEPKLGMQP